MLHTSETVDKALTTETTVNPLRPNDRNDPLNMYIKARDEVSSNSVLKMFGILEMDVVLRANRLRWFNHIERSPGCITLEIGRAHV